MTRRDAERTSELVFAPNMGHRDEGVSDGRADITTEEDGEAGIAAMAKEVEGVNVETKVLLGTPHAEVIRYAREENIDLIVQATHGRKGLSHALIAVTQ